MKRWLAILMAVAMMFSAIPLTAFAESTDAESTVDTEGVTVEATNGLGTLLSEEITAYQEETAEAEEAFSGGYTIVDLTVDGNTAVVEYAAIEEAQLVVSLYTEDGLQLLVSGYAVVSPDETAAVVPLEGTIPEYFMASAYMVDTFDCSPLCPSYSTPMYTQEMQQLLASTAEDYDADKVLNLDEDTTTNFAVYTDSTIIIDRQNGVNTVASIDDENAVYVIENANESFTGLQIGDVFSYAYAEDEYLIAKVATITVDGTTVTITGDDVELEEVFSHMKLEYSGDATDAEVDTTVLEDGVTYEGLTGDEVQTFAFEGDSSKKYSFTYGFDKKFSSSSDKVDGEIKLSGTMSLSMEFKLSYYIALKRQYISFQTDVKTTGKLSAEGEISAGLPLGIYMIPFGGCVAIGFEPELQLKFSGEVSASVSASFILGFKFENKTFSNISTAPIVEAELSAEGTLFFGVDMAPTLLVVGGKALDASLEMPIGVEVKATYSTKVTTAEPTTECIHACENCLEFTIYFKAETTAKIKLLKSKRLTFSYTFTPINIKIGTMYWSFDYDDFGWGDCPYKKYRISVYVEGADGNALPYATVTATGKEYPYTQEELGTTNGNGVLVCYLAPNTYDFVVSGDGDEVTGSAEVEEACKVYLTCNQISAPDILLGEVNIGTLIESSNPSRTGSCGDNVQYEFYNFGLLKISGTGSMAYYSSASEQPWYDYADSITMVVIEEGVTAVGSYAFAYCQQMKSLDIPNSVTEIGVSAFQACLGLTSLTVPDGVTVINGYAFYACSGLTELVIPNGVKQIGIAAFAECHGLTEIYLPASVTKLGAAWLASDNLTGYTVDPNNPTYKSIDGVLYNKTGTTLMLVPGQYEGVYYIPAGVTRIEASAFECQEQLTQVHIPDTVTSIGSWAFKGCTALTMVVFYGDAPAIADDAFYGWNTSIDAYYPADNETWTEDMMQDYGGTITWIENSVVTVSEDPDGTGTEDDPVSRDDTLENVDDLLQTTAATEENGGVSTYGLWGGDYETEQTPDYDLKTATFSGLVAGEQYLMLSLVSIEAEDLLAPSNLLYVAQGTAADDGTLCVTYVQRVDTELSYVIACGASHKNLNDSVITFPTMVETGELQTVEPTVMYDGKRLEEGIDYTISGVADYTAAGTYTCYIRGIYNYSGRVECQYTVVELPVSGTCGEALTWTLGEDGVLTISGSGPMTEFADDTSAPWYACREVITEVVVGKEVTSVSDYAFSGCTNLRKVSFLGNAPTFGENAFASVGFTANYPMYDPTWNDDVKQNYGGSVAWTGVEFPCEHTNTELVDAKTATCQENGYTGDTVCKDCYKTITAGSTITMLDHDYLDNVCVNCGATKPILQVASGKCGTNLTWIYWDNGLLEISGTGEMYNYPTYSTVVENGTSTTYYIDAPWYEYRESITAIKIGSGATSIGTEAFKDCAALVSVEVPNNITTIGKGAFQGCSSLESITLPFVGGNTRKPTQTYQYPLGWIFGTVAYEGGVSTYQYYYGYSTSYTSYTKYYIPASLKTVTVTGGYILYGAFYNCSNLEQVHLGAGVLGIETNGFYQCGNLTAIWVDEANPYYCSDAYGVVYSKDMTTLIICPGGYEGSYTIAYGAATVAKYAFSGCSKLTDVTFSSSVTEIETYAFYKSTALMSVELNEGLTNIGNYAFSNCTALPELTVPDTATSIGKGALEGCTSLRTLVVPYVTTASTHYSVPTSVRSITITGGTIPKGVFSKYLTSVTLGDGVESIEAYAFSGCAALTEISIGSGVTTIGEYAFEECKALQQIMIPGTVDSVGKYAFIDCAWLITVTIGCADSDLAQDQTTTLDGFLFSGCSKLTSVSLGRGVSSVLYSTFFYGDALQAIWVDEDNPYYCSDENGVLYTKDMTTLVRCPRGFSGSFVIPDAVTTVGEAAFFSCRGLTTVIIGNGVTLIEANAFSGCTSLTAVSIGPNVEKINSLAFDSCTALTSVTIPASVTELGNVFMYCLALKEVCFLGSAPTMSENLFYNVTATAYYRSNSTWTSSVRQNYGGTVTWVSTTSPCQHSQTMTKNAVAATCTTEGYTGDIFCMSCLILRSTGSVIPVTDHKYTNVYVPATCTQEGSITYTCTVCDYSYGNVLEKTDHAYESVRTEPTCTLEGNITYTCTACGDSYYEVLGKLPHNYESVTTAPTCTEAGFTTYTCSACGDSYQANHIAALDHPNRQHQNAEAATCTTAGYSGDTVCLDCGELLIAGNILPALGHTHKSETVAPTCTEQGYTVYTCDCGDSYTDDYTAALGHSYTGRQCNTCGYIDPMKFLGTSTTLGGALTLDFMLDTAQLNGTTGNYIVLTRTYNDGTEDDVVTIPQSEWTCYNNTTYYTVSYTDIAAKEIADEITALVYNAAGEVISEPWTDSIATYAQRMLGKENVVADAELRTVYVDLLNYGAAAQTYFDYNTENLANANLTEEQASWATAAVEVTDKSVYGTAYLGGSMTLVSEITLDMVFNVVYEEGMYAEVTFTDHYGDVVKQTLTPEDLQGSFTQVHVTGMAIADYQALVTCELYDAEGNLVGNAVDSMESYAARNADKLGEIVQAIMKLGASAYAYFH